MKLLFVGYLHGFGGAEKMIIMLANEMAKRKHDVTLVALAENNPSYPVSNKVKYFFGEDKGNRKFSVILGRYRILKRKINEFNPDLIIHFNLQSAYLCAFMSSQISKKTIYSERGDPYDKEYKGILGLLRYITFKRIKGFVFQTAGARDYFNENIKKRSCIIHNPVFLNPDEYPAPEVREKRIVTIGRLSEQKNQKLLIDAIAKLPKDKYNHRVEIYGDGELKNTLQKHIDELKLSDRVLLMGTFSDIHKRIQNASLFVLTSDYEGMPNALLEAMTMGLPCISTDCRPGGARELIEDGINGMIVPCANAEELSNAINSLLNNPELAEIFAKEAQKKAARAKPSIIYGQWEAFFQKQLDFGEVH